MRNLLLSVSYDGTHYAGFQIQKNASTIQGVLESTLRKILKQNVHLLSAGRTDAGVHAFCNLVSVKTASSISLAALKRALNSNLPQDISIKKVGEVPLNFHPRFDALSKHYRYTLRNHPLRSPFDRFFTTFYPYPLDISAMRKAAKHLRGIHDFKAFQAKDKRERASRRRIHRLSIRRKSPYVFIDIEGDGFLYKMVGNIVGTLLEIGRGKRNAQEMRRLLVQKDRQKAGKTALAEGLCLLSIRYPFDR